MLQRYFNLPAVDLQRTLDEQLAFAERLRPLLLDVTGVLAKLRSAGANVLFEGAQGAMLDVDVGTYPFVTSSNTTAGGAATGTGLGPRYFDHVIGIVKAYATRVGAGPFPTELFDSYGDHMSRVGHEFGSVTGRRRRCGWFDAVALRRTVVNSSVSGLCMTKLDVLDGLDSIRICTGYRIAGVSSDEPPVFADALLPGGARVRAIAGMERVDRRRVYLPGASSRSAALPGARAGNPGGARGHDFDRTGSRSHDCPTSAVCGLSIYNRP